MNLPTKAATSKDAFVYLITEQVFFSLFSHIALHIDIDKRLCDAVWSQIAIGNTLFKRIGKYWQSEILEVISTLYALGRCCQTYLGGFVEIGQDLVPLLILIDTGAMALIHHDQIEEVLGIAFIRLAFARLDLFFILHPLAIETHVDLKAAFSTLALNFRHHLTEGLEVLAHGLVNQDITVCQIKNAFHATRGMQTVNDLECSIGLTCTRCHHQQDTFLPTSYCLYDFINSYTLIIAWRITVAITIIRNVEQLCTLFGEIHVVVHPLAMTFTKLQRGGEIIHIDRAFLASIHIMLHKLLTIAGISIWHVQIMSIVYGLLDAVGRGMFPILCLNDGNRIVVLGI